MKGLRMLFPVIGIHVLLIVVSCNLEPLFEAKRRHFVMCFTRQNSSRFLKYFGIVVQGF